MGRDKKYNLCRHKVHKLQIFVGIINCIELFTFHYKKIDIENLATKSIPCVTIIIVLNLHNLLYQKLSMESITLDCLSR